MWPKLLIILFVSGLLKPEMTAPGIDRTISEGIKSLGYNVVYGDEDMLVINQVISDSEKGETLNKINFNQAIAPLPAEDVKCLMSVDRYCTKNMGKIKSILIEALRDDCVKCSVEDKESAGKIVASMMAHDPVAWKLFLTRSALQILPEKKAPTEGRHKYKIIGDPVYIENTRNRYTMPGVKVRVKRYTMKKIN